MTPPDLGAGESLCGENSCRKLLRDMEGASCFDCGPAITYCPDHILTSPCGSTQCVPCWENGGGCACHVCEKSAKDEQVEARHDR